MERISNSSYNNEYPEELKDLGAASLTIASLRHKSLDKQTTKDLNKLIAKIQNQNQSKNHQNFQNCSKKQQAQQPSFVDHNSLDLHNPPGIPPVPNLNGLIGSCSKPFVKLLTNSDLRVDQSRLSLNKSKVEESILPLLNEDEDPTQGIMVDTYDLNGNKFPMTFKFWNSKYYVLTSGWTNFHKQNGLEAIKDLITVWMFRHKETGKLCFVITSRKLAMAQP